MKMPMSWVRSVRKLTATLSAIAALGAPGYAVAGIVIASSGPSAASFPPGKKLPDDARITLKNSDSVTILDAKGTRVLRGAGTFTVGAAGATNRSVTFAALTRLRSAQRVRTGAVRGVSGPPASPNLWYVDLTRSGTFCTIDPDNIRVWRPEKDGDAIYRVALPNGAKVTTLTFSDGVTVAPWDVHAAPVTDGSSYTISGKADEPAVTVKFVTLPNENYAPEELASALLAKGCGEQVNLLATSLALPQDDRSAM